MRKSLYRTYSTTLSRHSVQDSIQLIFIMTIVAQVRNVAHEPLDILQCITYLKIKRSNWSVLITRQKIIVHRCYEKLELEKSNESFKIMFSHKDHIFTLKSFYQIYVQVELHRMFLCIGKESCFLLIYKSNYFFLFTKCLYVIRSDNTYPQRI